MTNDINELLELLFNDTRNPSSTPALYSYALAYVAQDQRLPSALKGTHSHGLLGDSDSVRNSTPHLIALPRKAEGIETWKWMARNATKNPCLTIFRSKHAFPEVFSYLSAFLDVAVNKDTTMVLAFWDPMILATLLGFPQDNTLHVSGPDFNTARRALFLDIFNSISYWDRRGRLQHIHPEPLYRESPAKEADENESVLPLAFNPDQVRDMVEASLPDQVLYELRLNRPGILMNRGAWENYSLTCRLVRAAHEFHIRGLRDLVNFVGTGMILGEEFYHYPIISEELTQVQQGKLTFTAMLSELPADVLEEAMKSSKGSDSEITK